MMLFEVTKHTDMGQSESATAAERDPDRGPLRFCVLLRCCCRRKQKAHSKVTARNC